MKLLLINSHKFTSWYSEVLRHFECPLLKNRNGTIMTPYHPGDMEELEASHQFEQHIGERFGELDSNRPHVMLNLSGSNDQAAAGMEIYFPGIIKALYDCFGAQAWITVQVELIQLRKRQNGKVLKFKNVKSKEIKLLRGDVKADDMEFPYENEELKTALKTSGILKGIMNLVVVVSCGTLRKLPKAIIPKAKKENPKISFFTNFWRRAEVVQSDSKQRQQGGNGDEQLMWVSVKFKEESLSGNSPVVEVAEVYSLEPTPLTSGTSDSPHTLKKMLQEEIATDVALIPGNGNSIKAHKAVLCTHSDVFMTMFRTDMEETKTHTVQIPDMSEESVRGLLAFLYYGDKSAANCKPMVAFELLNAGHKYNISALEETMRKLLLGKTDHWYDRKVAMKLFLFSRNLPKNGDKLKTKALQVLKANFADLRYSPEYYELFKENPDAAMELCNFILDNSI